MFSKVGVLGQTEAGHHAFGDLAGSDKVYQFGLLMLHQERRLIGIGDLVGEISLERQPPMCTG